MSKEYWEARHRALKENGCLGLMSVEIDNNTRDFIKKIKQYIIPFKCETIIDYGCGTGKMARFLKEFFGGYYIGYDIVDFLIEDNKKRFPELDFRLVNDCFVDGVDMIWCGFVLQHLPDHEVEEILIRFKNMLNDCGKIYIICAVGEKDGNDNMFFRTIKKYKQTFKNTGLAGHVAFFTQIAGTEVACFEVKHAVSSR